MKIVSLNCPKCGGKLDLEADRKTATCSYCGSFWYLEDDNNANESVLQAVSKETAKETLNKKHIVAESQSEQNNKYQTTSTTRIDVSEADNDNYYQTKKDVVSNDNGSNALFVIVPVTIIFIIVSVFLLSLDPIGNPVISGFVGGFSSTILCMGLIVKLYPSVFRNISPGKLFGVLFLIFFLIYSLMVHER